MGARAEESVVRGAGVATLLAMAFFAATASAQESAPRARLVWQPGPGTESCVSSQELQQLVEVQLGREVFARGETVATATLRVTLETAPKSKGFRALVRAEREATTQGEPEPPARELVSESDCRALDEQLTLVVALLVDAEMSRPPPPPVDPEPPPPPPEPEPPPQEAQPLGPVSAAPGWDAAQKNAPWRFELDLAGAVGIGVLPHVGGGGEFGFLAVPPGLPGLRVRAMVLTSAPAELTADASVGFLLGMGGVALCPEIASSTAVRLTGCLNVDAGVLHAKSQGLEEGQDSTRVVPMLGLAFRGTLKLGGPWLGVASAGVSLPTKVDRYVYRQDGSKEEVFQMALLPFLATLGVACELL
jgi:hypothetical protein